MSAFTFISSLFILHVIFDNSSPALLQSRELNTKMAAGILRLCMVFFCSKWTIFVQIWLNKGYRVNAKPTNTTVAKNVYQSTNGEIAPKIVPINRMKVLLDSTISDQLSRFVYLKLESVLFLEIVGQVWSSVREAAFVSIKRMNWRFALTNTVRFLIQF